MILNKNYEIIQDDTNTILKFSEPRIRKDNEGNNVEYIGTEQWYYPNLKSALKAYLNKSIYDETIVGVIKKIESVEELILAIS